MKKPIATVICCLFTAATIIAYSQEPLAPAQAEVPALPLPAENFALTDVNGRTITVTVLSMATDKLSIVIRTADGNEVPILTSRLNAATLEKIMGGKIVPVMPVLSPRERQAQHQARSDAAGKASREIFTKLKDLSAYELHKRFLANDEEVTTMLIPAKNSSEDQAKGGTASDPNWARYNRSGYSLLSKIKVKPPEEEEKVSLRAQFEKLGVVTRQQIGNTCFLHASYNLFQFACLADGGKPPKLRPLTDAVKDSNAVKDLKKAYGKRPITQWLSVGNPKLNIELAKHQLRNGKACTIRIQGNSHSVVAVGFHAKDGVTTFEYLNTNQLYIDKGYGWSTPYAEVTAGDHSLWFE